MPRISFQMFNKLGDIIRKDSSCTKKTKEAFLSPFYPVSVQLEDPHLQVACIEMFLWFEDPLGKLINKHNSMTKNPPWSPYVRADSLINTSSLNCGAFISISWINESAPLALVYADLEHWGACPSSDAISEHYTKISTVQQLSNLSVVVRKHPVDCFGEVGFALNNLWHPESLVSGCWSPAHLHLLHFDNCSKCKSDWTISWFVHHDQTYHKKLIIQRSVYYVYYIIYNIQYIYYIFNKT